MATLKSKPIKFVTIQKVLQNMIELCNDPFYEEMFAASVDEMLEGLSGEDAFGTEGSKDPRGDQREGPWYIRGR